MRRDIFFWHILILLTFLLCASSSLASQFQGDVLDSRGMSAFKGHIWVKDAKYRLEMNRPDSPEYYVIVGARAGISQVVFPKYKVYMELPSNDMISRMNDPFQAAEGTAKNYEVKIEGRDNIQGFDCEQQLVHYDGNEVMRRWYSPELGFYIKNEQLQQDDWYVLLQNIEQKKIQDSQFQIPGDYTLKSSDEISKLTEADQELAAKIAAYKKSRPRKVELSNLLSANDKWNLVLNPGMNILIKVKTRSETDSWFAVPYKGEAALKSMSECTHQGEGDIKINPELHADGISIGLVSGKNIHVSLITTGKLPHIQAARRVFNLAERSGSNWMAPKNYSKYKVTIQALSTPAAGFRFKANGKKYEEKLPFGQSKSYSFTSQDNLKDLDIMIDFGKVKVVCIEDNRTQTASHVLLDNQTEDNTGTDIASAPSRNVDTPKKEETQIPAQRGSEPESENAPNESRDAVRTMLVLDASGSMWGQIDGKAKIEIAKEVLTDLINDLPDSSYAGLVAYGHRSKGDCNDVEELMPLQPIDKKQLIAKIKGINPKGKTPITLSIRKTAEKLKAVEEETTIILVSDGKETCEGDPCALVKELKEAGIRFTMYVIGFDVSEEEKVQLECIAEAGDGKYFTARTVQEFQVAAKEAVKESQNFGYLKISSLRNGKPISARVDVFSQGQQKTMGSFRTAVDSKWPGQKWKPGVYDLTVTDDRLSPPQKVSLSGISVTAGSTTEKSVGFNGGSLSVEVIANGKKETASLYVYPVGQDRSTITGDTSRDNPKTFVLNPGVYDLEVVYKKSRPETKRTIRDIKIEAGQSVERRVEFGEGKLSIEVLVNGEKGSAGFSIYEAGTNNRVATGDSSRDNPRVFALNPGTYDLQVIYKGSKPESKRSLTGIVIEAGKSVEKRVEFGEGKLSIEILVNGEKGSAGFSIYEAGTNNRVATGDSSRDNPKVFTLNSGNYDIQVAYRKVIPEKEIVLKNIQVTQGKISEQHVEYQEGILNVNVTSEGQPTPAGLSFFYPGESKRLATGNAGKPAKMQPGQYEVAVKAYKLEGRPEKRIPFTIQVGKTINLDVDF
jgi:Ca-activated chloride channel homolog